MERSVFFLLTRYNTFRHIIIERKIGLFHYTYAASDEIHKIATSNSVIISFLNNYEHWLCFHSVLLTDPIKIVGGNTRQENLIQPFLVFGENESS